MAVRMRKVRARPWVGVRVCHLRSLLLHFFNVHIMNVNYVNIQKKFDSRAISRELPSMASFSCGPLKTRDLGQFRPKLITGFSLLRDYQTNY